MRSKLFNGISPIEVPVTRNDTSTKTTENERLPPDLSPLGYITIIEQMRFLQRNKLELMDYIESLLINHQSKTKQRFSLSSDNSFEK